MEPVYVVVECSGGVVQDVLHGDFVQSIVWDWDDFKSSDERALEMLRDAIDQNNPYAETIIRYAKEELLTREAR